jgi:hypothetical protein
MERDRLGGPSVGSVTVRCSATLLMPAYAFAPCTRVEHAAPGTGYQPPLPWRPARFARVCGWRHTPIKTPPSSSSRLYPQAVSLRVRLHCAAHALRSSRACSVAFHWHAASRIAVGFMLHQEHRPDHTARTLRPLSVVTELVEAKAGSSRILTRTSWVRFRVQAVILQRTKRAFFALP